MEKYNFNFHEWTDKDLINQIKDHFNKVIPLNPNDSILIFRNLECLYADEDTCKKLYLLMQEDHICRWISENAYYQFEIEKISNSILTIKNTAYNDISYSFFTEHGSFNRKNRNYFTDIQLSVAQEKLLIERNYLVPLNWFSQSSNYNKFKCGHLTPKNLMGFVNNVQLQSNPDNG